MLVGALLFVPASIVLADSVRPIVNKDTGFTTIPWQYNANATGAATAETTHQVYGQLFRVYHYPDAGLNNTWTLSVSEKIADPLLTNTPIYSSDISSGWLTSSTTGSLETFAIWPNSGPIPVSSELRFSLTGATESVGGNTEGAEGYFYFVVSPLTE